MITSLQLNNDSITGRLGNKLFLIAAMIGVAERNNDKVMLPHWEHKDVFENIATGKLELIQKNINCAYQEPFFHYAPIPFKEGANMDLRGYFQSEKYFSHCRDEVRNAFNPNAKIQQQVDDKWDEIRCAVKVKEENIVLVQVRAGWGFANDYHGILPMEYFEKAFKKFPKCKFVMFSDEIEKCKVDFKHHGIHFVDNTNPIVDLFLSAKCNHAIIPNSSFSWWSAWLIKNKDKRVIAPKAWFGSRGRAVNNTKDLYMQSWEIM